MNNLAKISLGISVVLLLVTGFLFYKVNKLSTPAGETLDTSPAPTAAAFSGDSVHKPVVAYINGDTVMAKYQRFKEMEETIKSSFRSSNQRVQEQIEAAQKESDELIAYAQKMGDKLPQNEAQDMQNRMMELEYRIQELKQKEEDALLDKERKMNEDLMKAIREYLARYCKDHGIDMVMNYMELNQGLLYGNGAFDITNSVVEGLNAEYQIAKGN